MYKKLCILLIFSKLKLTKVLIDPYRMHNLYAIFARFLDICKQVAGNLVMNQGMFQEEEWFPDSQTLK